MYKSIKRKTRAKRRTKRGTKRGIVKRGVKRSYRKNKRGGGSRRKTKNVKRRGSKRTKRTMRRRRRVLRGGVASVINDNATVGINKEKWKGLNKTEQNVFIKNIESNSGNDRPGEKCKTIEIDNINYGYVIYSVNDVKDSDMIGRINEVLPNDKIILKTYESRYVLVKFAYKITFPGARRITYDEDDIPNIKFNLNYTGLPDTVATAATADTTVTPTVTPAGSLEEIETSYV